MSRNVALVLVGQSFPIQQIRASDFEFNHRKLTERVRLPMVVQMNDRGVTIQALPDRFEVVVADSVDFAADIPRAAETASKIFDYVGPKSITAIGHNAQVKLPDTNGRKLDAYSELLSLASAERLLGSPATDADLAVLHHCGGSQGAP